MMVFLRQLPDPQIMNYQKRQQLPWISAYQDGFCWTREKEKALISQGFRSSPD
jgi:hypothetical protein